MQTNYFDKKLSSAKLLSFINYADISSQNLIFLKQVNCVDSAMGNIYKAYMKLYVIENMW